MILNRVKEGVHGFPGDGLLSKNVRGRAIIDMQNADRVLTKEESLCPFKFVLNLGDGARKLIFPTAFDKLAPVDQYIALYSESVGAILFSETANQGSYLFGVSHAEVVTGNPIFVASNYYAENIRRFHGGINNFAGDFSPVVSDLKREHVYEGGGGNVITIDGSISWPDNAELRFGNASGGSVALNAINAANIVNPPGIPFSESFRLLKQLNTNNWYFFR